MPDYRSKSTINAVQYTGEPIPDVICNGDRDEHGCDSSRAHMPHVHSNTRGGLTVVTPGDWIVAVRGGPFEVYTDARFRGLFEVPDDAPEKPKKAGK